MPTLPLYNDGRATRTTAGPFNGQISPGGRGVHIDSAALMGAVQVPQLDDSGIKAQGRGAASLGAGIASLGEGFMDIAREQAKNLNIKRVGEARRAMELASQELAAAHINQPDETKWYEMTAKTIADAPKGWMRPDLSPIAKDEIESMTESWKTSLIGETVVNVARKTKDDVTRDEHDTVTALARNEKPKEAYKLIDQMVELNHISVPRGVVLKQDVDAEVERAGKQRENAREKAAIEEAVGWANHDADMAASVVNDPKYGKGLLPTTVATIRNRVQAAQADSFAAVNGAVAAAIVTGKARTPEDIANIAGHRVRPHELKKLQDDLMQYQTEAKKLEMSTDENQRALFGEALDRVAKFDREALGGVDAKAARDEYSDILGLTKWLDVVRRGEVTGPLAKKWFAAAPEIDSTVKGYIRESIKDYFDAGAFGETKIKVPKVEGDEGYLPYKKEFKTITNDAGLREARIKMADAMIALTEWEKTNPKATREDATQALYFFAGQAMRADESDSLLEKARAKTAAPVDLPAIRRRLEQRPAGVDTTPATKAKGTASPPAIPDGRDPTGGAQEIDGLTGSDNGPSSILLSDAPPDNLTPPNDPAEAAAWSEENQARIDAENERRDAARKAKKARK